MRRSWTFLAVLFLTLLDVAHVAAAPASATVPRMTPLDLAAFQIQPGDVDEPNPQVRDGNQYDITAFSGHWADDLKEARYVASHLLVIDPGGDDPDYQISSTIHEFGDAKGAAVGYEALAYTSVEDDAAHRVGDVSTYFAASGADPYNPKRRFEQVSIMFRQGSLVGEIKVSHFDGTTPSLTKGRMLAKKLAARLQAGQAGKVSSPGFGYRILQLAVSRDETMDASYWILNGVTLHQVSTAKGSPNVAERYAGATDSFALSQHANEEDTAPAYFARLANFPDDRTATEWVKTYLAVRQRGQDGLRSVKEVAGATGFGDQSHTATFIDANTGPGGETIYGALIVARFGSIGAAIEVKAYKRVPVALIASLMAAQAQCLASSGRCARLAVPAALDDLTLVASVVPAGILARRLGGGPAARPDLL